MTEPFEESYFNWLYSKVGGISVHNPSLRFVKLLAILHKLEFVWTVLGDDNRAEDGKDLRIEYVNSTHIQPDEFWLQDGCSMLEMLIAFSRRAEFETDISARDWFWKMLDNIGLSECNDATDPDPIFVEATIERLVWRLYDNHGHGGLFPLQATPNDQREVEVWYQFCEYVFEEGLI
jgi:hypothetical protein